ncbi:hypothetical protein PsYK624_062600 [Phanerochaete sordida]|uniref:Uncharacterized protein n=1 Tax=Phanerochaete sordida TaxID=48140 RepID=A0A9P3G8F4_9APHY|nr:hypothetical protein PsYK624_062600 [Phanerochaete sordida]
MNQICKDLDAKDAIKDVEAMRRGTPVYLPFRPTAEETEDAKARAAIKAQIAGDKYERAQKAAREKAAARGPHDRHACCRCFSARHLRRAAPSGIAGKDHPTTCLRIPLAGGGWRAAVHDDAPTADAGRKGTLLLCP